MQLKTLLITIILAIIFLFFLLLNEFNLLSKKNDWELKNTTNFDSIVVLTGKFDRIKKGFELLEANYSKKMFISGVNPIVKKNELRKIIIPNNSTEKISLFDCCVFIGKEAKNTKTNAVEVIKWMKKNNLISAILVTSDIHLPRSILEFQNNTNHIKITSWPVKTNSNNFINFLKEFLRFSFVRIKYLII